MRDRVLLWIHNAVPSYNPSEFCELIFTEDSILILHYGWHLSERIWYPFKRRRRKMSAARRRDELEVEKAFIRMLLPARDIEAFRELAHRETSLKYEEIERIEIGEGRKFLFICIKPFLKIWSRGRLFYYKIEEEEFEVLRRELEEISRIKGFELKIIS
ncbi:MAG: hypothetical protein PWR13_1260 [Archaeoglobi archaeon]|nr:hypothetical protein [Archaeoglobi archaeon]MDK2782232.1 hypothetical protein [Archaeoglobi archaeon]